MSKPVPRVEIRRVKQGQQWEYREDVYDVELIYRLVDGRSWTQPIHCVDDLETAKRCAINLSAQLGRLRIFYNGKEVQ